jgi:hypothetical protein
MSTPETQSGPETGVETPKVSAEQYERLSNPETAENLDIESGEKKAERSRVEALEKAVSVEKGGAEKDRKPSTTPPRRRGAISKKEKKASFKKHMAQVQAEMSAPQRAFSKVIHNPVVEKTSEVVGATIARPNALLAGSVVAFFAVLAVYLIARTYGYALSGFETIGAFAVGWIVGVVYDYLRVLITGKRG